MRAICDFCGKDFGEMKDSVMKLALHVAVNHDVRPSEDSVKRRKSF
jgi:hypothetical protein